MPRYYTICDFTPSLAQQRQSHRRKESFERIYPRAPAAFLFHDTNHEIDVSDIRHALFRLSDLHENEDSESGMVTKAQHALVVRANPSALVATFSIDGFLRPVKMSRYASGKFLPYDWLRDKDINIALIENVRDHKSPVVSLNLNQLYDTCTRLERMTGSCAACPINGAGCKNLILPAQLPGTFKDPAVLSSNYTLEYKTLQRVAYEKLPGDPEPWLRASPKTTTSAEFEVTFRPWDYHDFSRVEQRKEEMSKRAKQRHHVVSHTKNKCTTCAISQRKFSQQAGEFRDHCGFVRSCTAPVSELTAQAAIAGWLEQSKFKEMLGFTPVERDYLIRRSGETVKGRNIFGQHRAIDVVLGGFEFVGNHTNTGRADWGFRLAVTSRPYDRRKIYRTYAELREALPILPASEDITVEPVNDKFLYVLACWGERPYMYTRGRPAYRRRIVKLSGESTVSADGVCSSYVSIHATFNTEWSLYDHIYIMPHTSHYEVNEYYASLQLKTHLPVIRQ